MASRPKRRAVGSGLPQAPGVPVHRGEEEEEDEVEDEDEDDEDSDEEEDEDDESIHEVRKHAAPVSFMSGRKVSGGQSRVVSELLGGATAGTSGSEQKLG